VRSAHLEQLLLGLIVDDRDDARTAGLDELDVGAGDVGGRGVLLILPPAPSPGARRCRRRTRRGPPVARRRLQPSLSRSSASG
jgi:hypothetical protein